MRKMAQNPIVTIEMENGDVMKAELYPEIAPNTVNNFITLANNGFYDGLTFHRVIKILLYKVEIKREMVQEVLI
jgi:peptidyl-prolyl cis-trans isomerase B (cyclophilin B)